MNQRMLSQAVGNIRDDYIAEAYYRCSAEFLMQRKHRQRKNLATLVVAAALLLVFGTAAYAILADGGLSQFFSGRQVDELSPGQQDYLDTQIVTVSQSVTEGDYTVTLESTLCDPTALYMVVFVEGPEGVDLEIEDEEGSLFFDSVKFKSTDSGNIRWSGTTTYHLPDEDEKENTARLVLIHMRVNAATDTAGFTNGEEWQISLGRLSTQTGAYYENYTLLSDCEFKFTTQLTEQRDELELIQKSVLCKARFGGEGQEKVLQDIEVVSFVLRPLSAVCEFRLLSGGDTVSVEMLDVSLIMKNGDFVELIPKTGSSTSTGGTMLYGVSAPLVLEDVVGLILPENVLITRAGD